MLGDRLLQAAVEQFGAFGFDGASTRRIAQASGTAMSSITYHFGGKEGLYLAAASHIAEQIRLQMGPAVDAIDTRCAPAEAREQLLALLDGMAQMMLREESSNWSQFIAREQQQPTEAFERLYVGAMKAVMDKGVDLLRIVRPDLPEEELRATSVLLMGQALVLRMGRASVCRMMQVDSLDEETGRLLRRQLRASACCILAETPDA